MGVSLVGAMLEICQGWRGVFAQERTLVRALRHVFSGLCSVGRRTLSRAIMSAQRGERDWSADYLLYSRSPWAAPDLFGPAIQYTAAESYPGHIAVAIDDTKLRKTGRKIPGVVCQRDPLSLPFHVNLMYGIRFLQGSALVPLHASAGAPARGIPVWYQEAPVVKKPGKRAPAADWLAYRLAQRTENLSVQSVQALRQLRAAYDAAGAAHKMLMAVCDGSFCNRNVLPAQLERTHIVARCRKDAVLCWPAAPGSRRIYAAETFTPEDVRQNELIPWQCAFIYHGGAWRTVRYKEVSGVYWRGGGGQRRLRLIVIAPTPYRTTRRGRLYYRQPAYLLTTDLDSSTTLLIQMYFDRWEIEVNHREEKDTLGLGQAQVWSYQAVPRQPAFMVAAYSVLLIAGLKAYGPRRTLTYMPLPRWRRQARRPSCLDLVTQLRREITEHPELVQQLEMHTDKHTLLMAAAA